MTNWMNRHNRTRGARQGRYSGGTTYRPPRPPRRASTCLNGYLLFGGSLMGSSRKGVVTPILLTESRVTTSLETIITVSQFQGRSAQIPSTRHPTLTATHTPNDSAHLPGDSWADSTAAQHQTVESHGYLVGPCVRPDEAGRHDAVDRDDPACGPLADLITPPLALTSGIRLGPHEIVSAIGAGGMGTCGRPAERVSGRADQLRAEARLMPRGSLQPPRSVQRGASPYINAGPRAIPVAGGPMRIAAR